MATPKTAAECNLPPHWKVRIFVRGAGPFHVITQTEPCVIGTQLLNQDFILGTEHGDTIGFCDWNEVVAITWREAK